MGNSTKAEQSYATAKVSKNFPSARYFQVHFEFLQEQIQLIRRTQDALHMQMEQLDQRLLTVQPLLFSDDQHAFATKHSPLVSSPMAKQAGLQAGSKNPKKD